MRGGVRKYFFPKRFAGDKFLQIDVFDLMVMLANVWKGANECYVGFEDADQTIDELTKRFNYRAWARVCDLESALWSCNLMNELGKFWHPKGIGFDYFVLKLLKDGHRRFDKIYNVVEKKETDEKAT